MCFASHCPTIAVRPMTTGWAAMSTLTATGVRQTSLAKKMGKNLQRSSLIRLALMLSRQGRDKS